MRQKKLILGVLAGFFLLLFTPRPALAMHITEGFLPLGWCVFWGVLTLPFFIAGILSIGKKVKHHPELKMLLGLAGAFAFVLSALKFPL